ncbi:TIM44-like domain-containing protein [Enterovirga rhinocerotis]|uniref:Putative lipid-binding transport protein (Tim44 family) n=1 Tax=Enterovirga rhinocerotis TaxID=1339210 RepID=A0A4R7C4A0_9HYPH|nr:Tim44 domain-containing protein [Enterovirga rhinocerotis]TDR93218.1 putative lipid-binding transport protein (Tim44 family) [Enterovirga rhinocerotis]
MINRFRTLTRTALVAGLVTVLAAPIAEARPGGGKSFGSRGGSSWSAPKPTPTAPRGGAPIQRSETPSTAQRPGMAAPTAAQPRRFGLGTGIMAGLLGAGLFGMLTGSGFFGGIAGLASILGFLFQIALIAGLVWLALRFFRRRQEPAFATPGAAPQPDRSAGPMPGAQRSGLGGFGGGGRQPIEIGPEDYQAFERSLGEIQLSYGRGDAMALRRLATPEMAGYMEQDLAADRARGIRNEVSQPKLLQGDLAEAWREGTTEYATVAMRFEIVEAHVEIARGRVVEGNRTAPTEATEIWTFRRDMKGPWLLSAIQQAA